MQRSADWAHTRRGRVLTKVRDPTSLRLRTKLLILVAMAVFATILMLVLDGSLVRFFSIPSESMEPMIMVGDKVLVTPRAPTSIKRGEVIVFRSSITGDEHLIKRVVAVAGDTVEVHAGALYVSGVRQREPYLRDSVTEGVFPSTTVQPGYLFVLGDNRNNSYDSRILGQVPTSAVVGRAYAVWWPLWHIGLL